MNAASSPARRRCEQELVLAGALVRRARLAVHGGEGTAPGWHRHERGHGRAVDPSSGMRATVSRAAGRVTRDSAGRGANGRRRVGVCGRGAAPGASDWKEVPCSTVSAGASPACSRLGAVAALAPSAMAARERPAAEKAGNVYVLTNQVEANAVAVFDRGADGSLVAEGVYPTGGTGTAGSLASQGAVALPRRRLVLAVNAGSNSISSFRVRRCGLQLVDVEPSGGVMPTSIAYDDGLAYVLNAGAPNSISGFRVRFDGELYPIAGSSRALSGDQTAPRRSRSSPTAARWW